MRVIKYAEFEYVVQMEINHYNRPILMTSLIDRQWKGKDAVNQEPNSLQGWNFTVRSYWMGWIWLCYPYLQEPS